ncbi:MAG TPA: AraC family transcriptional regulator [Micromonosporaceae bacterium]
MRLNDLYRGGTQQHARHRVPVHLLALVTAGRASFTVDFTAYPCRPGGLLWVRPGQFVGFPPPGIDATLVLFEPEFPYDGAAPPGTPAITASAGSWAAVGTYWQPTGEDEEAIVDTVSQLEIDYNRIVTGDDIPVTVLRHQLSAILLRLGRLEPEGGPGLAAADSELLGRFRHDLDQRFAQTRQVEEYARSLGCSVRTLTRASLAATGRTAKQLVDDRVALEAKRLLAESDLPVAEVGARLGFTEATNFGRFFTRTVGVPPGQFRVESQRAAAEAAKDLPARPPAKPLAMALAKAGANRHRH